MAITPFEQANFNLVSFSEAYNDIFDSTAKDVKIELKDSNGNVYTKTVANRGKFQKQVWDDVGGALGQLNRTFYVDADNGDDNNDGSSANPFKTIKKACDSVPTSGIANIILLADKTYVLESDINIYNKKIIFLKHGNGNNPIVTTKTRTRTYGSNTYAEINNFHISGGALNFHSDVDIVVPSNSTGNNISPSSNGFIVPAYDTYNGAFIGFHHCSITINGDFPLINNDNWSGGSPFTDIKFWGVTVNLMKDGTKVISNNSHSTCSIGWSATLKDSSGNDISVSDNLLSGIVKDSNGVPRNVISNIVF